MDIRQAHAEIETRKRNITTTSSSPLEPTKISVPLFHKRDWLDTRPFRSETCINNYVSCLLISYFYRCLWLLADFLLSFCGGVLFSSVSVVCPGSKGFARRTKHPGRPLRKPNKTCHVLYIYMFIYLDPCPPTVRCPISPSVCERSATLEGAMNLTSQSSMNAYKARIS